jgi:hypothetical protein
MPDGAEGDKGVHHIRDGDGYHGNAAYDDDAEHQIA